MVQSPDGDIGYVDINSGVLQGDTLAQLLFIVIKICEYTRLCIKNIY